MSLFLCISHISLGQYCPKILLKMKGEGLKKYVKLPLFYLPTILKKVLYPFPYYMQTLLALIYVCHSIHNPHCPPISPISCISLFASNSVHIIVGREISERGSNHPLKKSYIDFESLTWIMKSSPLCKKFENPKNN